MLARRNMSASGFTLLELVIAMACVGLVAGGIALSISTCIKVWNRSAESAELNQEARAVMETISRDLRGVYFGLDRQTGYLIGQGAGEAGGDVEVIELATHGGAVERFTLLPDDLRQEWDLWGRPPLTDYLAVRYEWLKETSDQVAGLYRMTSPVPFSATVTEEAAAEEQPAESDLVNRELLSTDVSDLRFQYYDGEEDEWLDSWDSTDPAARGHPLWAVWVEMTLKDARGRKHVFETTVPIPTS